MFIHRGLIAALITLCLMPVAADAKAPALRIEVTDAAGTSLTGGFVALFPDAPPPDLSPKRARRLPSPFRATSVYVSFHVT